MTTTNDIPDEVVERVAAVNCETSPPCGRHLYEAERAILAYRAAMRERGIVEINADDLPWGQSS